MSTIRNIISKSEKKISIAIIGLTNSGKTTLIKKILYSQEMLQASLTNSSELEFFTLDNLTFTSWDLENTIPREKSLWKRSIMGADALFFIIDSADREKINLNRILLHKLIEYYSPIKMLILASKCDLPTSISISELLDALDLVEIDRLKCKCDLFKISSQTGEGLYALGEWLNKALFKHKEKIIDYAEIKAGLILDDLTNQLTESVFVENPNIILLTAFREMRRKARVFSQTVRTQLFGEEVVEIANFKVIFVKEKSLIIGLLFGFNDPINRTLDIARTILQFISSHKNQSLDLRKLIQDLYPLDLAK
ncbi:MAG: ADP-ribosylation factor-like protein [Candidatus Thorarchaeota archaeon]